MFISSIFAGCSFLILVFQVVREDRLFKTKIQPMYIFNRKVRYRIIENFQHSWKLCLTVGYSAWEDCLALKEAVLVPSFVCYPGLYANTYRKSNHQGSSLSWEHSQFDLKIDQPFLEYLWLYVRPSIPAWIFQQCLKTMFYYTC